MLLKKRPVLFFAIPFLSALLIGSVCADLLAPTVLFVVASALLCLGATSTLISFFMKFVPTKRLVGPFLSLGLALLIFGGGLFYFNLHNQNSQSLRASVGEMDKLSAVLEGTVTEASLDAENNARYTIKLTKAEPFGDRLVGKRVYLFAKGDTLFSYGDTISAKVRLALPVEGQAVTMREQRVCLNAFSRELPTLCKEAGFSVVKLFKNVNLYLCQKTDLLLKKPFSQLVKAMLLGDTSELDSSLSTIFMRGGLSHIFSVSGMHISIIASLLTALLSSLLLPVKIKNPIAVAAVWCLVLITGFKLPAIRAGAMMTISLIAPFFKRESDPISSLCIVSISVGLFNPFSPASLSFLLTALSTAGILLFSKRVSFGLKSVFKKMPKVVLESLCITLCATLAVLPITVLFFKGISLVSPITNLLLVPVLPLLFLLCILLLLFGGIPAIGEAISSLLLGLLKLLTAACRFLTDNGFAYIGLDFPFVSLWVLGSALVILLCFLLFYKRNGTTIKRIHFDKVLPTLFKSVTISFLALVVFMGFYSFLYRDTLEISPIASKDGISVVIRRKSTANAVVIKSDPQNDRQLLRLLEQKGITKLDAFVALDMKDGFSNERELIKQYFKTDKQLYPGANGALFKSGYGQKLSNRLFAFSLNGKNAAVTKTDNMTVLYTADVNIAKNFPCDLLIFGGDYEKIVEQTPSKCVIILDELLYESKPIYISL